MRTRRMRNRKAEVEPRPPPRAERQTAGSAKKTQNEKIAHAALVGRTVTEQLVTSLLRNIARLDTFMERWVAAIARGDGAADAIAQFLRSILFPPILFRVSNGTIYFTDGISLNIHYSDLQPDEAAAFLFMIQNRSLFFGAMRSPEVENMLPEYTEFYYNDCVRDHFPRAEMCARFIALLLLPHALAASSTTPASMSLELAQRPGGRGRVSQPRPPTGSRFLRMRDQCLLAVNRVQAEARPETLHLLTPMCAVLESGWRSIGNGWDPASEVYPESSADAQK